MKSEKVFDGNLTAAAGAVYDYEEVTGWVSGAIFKTAEDFAAAFPNLKKTGGYLDLRALTTLPANAKLTAGGSLYLGALATLPANAKLTAGGSLYLGALATLPANAKLTAGGYLDLRALTTLPANAKLTAGGYLDLGALATPHNHTGNNPSARALAKSETESAFASIGYSIADGILAKIVRTRGQVSKVVIVGKTEESYLVTDGEAWSHGKTLKEARDGLLYKIGNRDTTEFKSWTPDKIVSKRDAIRAYRAITGACEGGVRAWLERRKTPERISVRGIVELTRGAYGAEKFAEFFAESKVRRGDGK